MKSFGCVFDLFLPSLYDSLKRLFNFDDTMQEITIEVAASARDRYSRRELGAPAAVREVGSASTSAERRAVRACQRE